MNIIDYRLNIKPLNIFVDPQTPVEKAIITHAHTDHAKPGNGKVLATKETIEIMKLRYGNNCARSFQSIRYGEKIKINGINISFFPAGHILGSAQILIENQGYKTLITGDYKTVDDEISKIARKLDNPGFVAKAPAEVVEENRRRLDEENTRRVAIEAALARLG